MWLSFLIGFLTVVLVLDCLFLLLLILIQLPKKEAGLGQAFGSGTTDALFGAGSGTALTKMTKYGAVTFFVLTFLLAILNAQQYKAGGGLRKALEQASKEAAAQPPTPAASAVKPPVATNAALKLNLPPVNTNPAAEAPVAPPSTSAPAAAPAK
jgi:preprotein translocase subunit SecG